MCACVQSPIPHPKLRCVLIKRLFFVLVFLNIWVVILKKFNIHFLSIEQTFPRRTQNWRTGACTLVWNILGGIFVKFDYLTRMFLNCSQHAMFSIYILFSTIPTPYEFYRAGTAPRFWNFCDCHCNLFHFIFTNAWILDDAWLIYNTSKSEFLRLCTGYKIYL